jgi:predicted dehydrogenase
MLCSADVRRVFARTTAHFHQLYVDNEVEDLASVTLEFERQLVGSFTVGRIGKSSHPDLGEIKLHVLGSKGALVISEARPEVSIYYRDQPATEFKCQRLLAADNDYLLADDFARAIDTDCQTILDVRTSRQITAIVSAAIQSGRSGKPEDVPPIKVIGE